MKTNEFPTCTLCDTSYIATYEEYVENCNALDEEVCADNSSEYWDFVADIQTREYEDFITNLIHSKNNVPCILQGSIGLWNGTREIVPYYFTNVLDAVKKANCGDDLIITQEDGVINVRAPHHDGTNSFTISKLNDEGISALSELSNGDICDDELTEDMLCKFEGYLY